LKTRKRLRFCQSYRRGNRSFVDFPTKLSFLCAACCFCVPSAIAQPDFVWNYFRRLAKLLTAGTSAIVEQIGAEEMKYGHCLYPSVEAYFEERRQFIVENEVNSTLLYWWDKAGIAPQSILSEAVHNALAWG